jgi:hypothetical protein
MVQTLANIPIWVEGRVGGVLGVYNRRAQGSFSDHHVQLLRGLAAWAGVTLERLQRAPAGEPGNAAVGSLPGGISVQEFRQAMTPFIAEVAKAVGTNPNLPNRANLWKLRAQVEDWLKRLPPDDPTPAAIPQGAEVFAFRKIIGDALQAVQKAAELKKVPILTQMTGEFPSVIGIAMAAQAGLQTLLGWSIARSNQTPIDLILFHTRSGEPNGPFIVARADRLPPGDWLVLSVVDSGPPLTAMEAAEMRKHTQQMQAVSPLGAALRQIRSAHGLFWIQDASEPITIYIAFKIVG